MKNILIIIILLTQVTLAEPTWAIEADIQVRLNQALELIQREKVQQLPKPSNAFVTVGDDGVCDFRVGAKKIQNAIDSGASEIRIASNTSYEENILIENSHFDLSIRGGFADCTEAKNDNQSNAIEDRAEITRVSGQVTPVFSIKNLPSGVTTTFENLKIIGGDSQGQGSGGSVNFSTTNSDGVFNNVWMTGANKSFTGGGLSVVSSNTIVILNNTDIFNNNVADSGGGVYCNNFSGEVRNGSIILAESSNLYSNHADGSGGGALIGADCFFASFSGSSKVYGEKGIYDNIAVNHGGAISVNGGGDVLIHGHIVCDLSDSCLGNATDPASVYGNTANTIGMHRNGGAIDASGIGTTVTIIAGHVYGNTISPGLTRFGSGGAISLLQDASLDIHHPGLSNTTVDCWSEDRCNLLNDNSGHAGGVIYANDSQVAVTNTYFEDNRANVGTVAFLSGVETTEIRNSVFNNNGNNGIGAYDDDFLIQVFGPRIIMAYSTIADNKTESGVFFISESNSSLSLQSSIIHDVDSGNVINASSGTITSKCVMAHEISSFSGSNNALDDPEFVDRANRDYHLDTGNSPAIDYCSILASFVGFLDRDIDYQRRGFDDLNLSNFLGPFDIGADEAYVKTFLTVGGDVSCDFNTSTHSIQDAIDTGIGEVRIAANGLHDKPVRIENRDVKLRGGFSDCGAANNNETTGQTQIVVSEVGVSIPALTITGDAGTHAVVIENLVFSGIDATAVRVAFANAKVLLNNILIENGDLSYGDSEVGGGVFIAQSSVDLKMVDTIIRNNSTREAGGLYCNGSEATVTMSGNSGLAFNTTKGKGGGAYITNSCKFTMYSGIKNPTAQSSIGISANIAGEEGGGIYVDLGGEVTLYGHEDCSVGTCIGDNINPVNVNHNKSNDGQSSGERGGGIYLTGSGTKVRIYAGLISENRSPNGGGVYVNDFASLTVDRLSKECWDSVRCNFFFGNFAFGTGGAIQNDQGFINVSSTFFEENISWVTASVLYAFGSNSHNTFESSVFNNNNSQALSNRFIIRAAVSANVEISHSTFADNNLTDNSVFGIAADSELRLLSSIVHEPSGFVLNSDPGSIVIDCLMAHETTSIAGTNIILDDPEFIDRANRNYHLDREKTAAIDVCDDSLISTNFADIDFDDYGIDDINVPNVNGPYDLGADEAVAVPVLTELIFKNGFE